MRPLVFVVHTVPLFWCKSDRSITCRSALKNQRKVEALHTRIRQIPLVKWCQMIEPQVTNSRPIWSLNCWKPIETGHIFDFWTIFFWHNQPMVWWRYKSMVWLLGNLPIQKPLSIGIPWDGLPPATIVYLISYSSYRQRAIVDGTTPSHGPWCISVSYK